MHDELIWLLSLAMIRRTIPILARHHRYPSTVGYLDMELSVGGGGGL